MVHLVRLADFPHLVRSDQLTDLAHSVPLANLDHLNIHLVHLIHLVELVYLANLADVSFGSLVELAKLVHVAHLLYLDHLVGLAQLVLFFANQSRQYHHIIWFIL